MLWSPCWGVKVAGVFAAELSHNRLLLPLAKRSHPLSPNDGIVNCLWCSVAVQRFHGHGVAMAAWRWQCDEVVVQMASMIMTVTVPQL